MKRHLLGTVLLATLVSCAALSNTHAASPAPLSDSQIAAMRLRGQAALDELFEQRDQIVAEQRRIDSPEQAEEGARLAAELAALDAVIDRVGAQRYCSVSRLFWHTDIESAKAASKKADKPILSLRMMGVLTDEYSCANSRFFRTTLYANEEISKFLREHFVLHWQSVRPVPKVTIDFGDGRKLERTLTGNSAHYALDSDGQPIDGLPGLYSPKKFLDWLKIVEKVDSIARNPEAANVKITKPELLEYYHSQQLRRITNQWEADLRKIGEAEIAANKAEQAKAGDAAPPAEAAAEIAMPKALVEMPIIRVVTMTVPKLEADTDEAMWEKIAALHADETQLDDASVRLIRSENPNAAAAGARAITKRRVEDPLVRMLAGLRSSIALDTVRNEYQLHRKLHEWFLEETPTDVDQLNDRVYAELFLTPSSDPWIGLVRPDTYTGLENGGIVRTASQ